MLHSILIRSIITHLTPSETVLWLNGDTQYAMVDVRQLHITSVHFYTYCCYTLNYQNRAFLQFAKYVEWDVFETLYSQLPARFFTGSSYKLAEILIAAHRPLRFLIHHCLHFSHKLIRDVDSAAPGWPHTNTYLFNTTSDNCATLLKTSHLKIYAVEHNNLDALQWLYDINTNDAENSYDAVVTAQAASNGHLHILKWLCDPTTGGGSCPCDQWACTYAAQYGHLDILIWLRDPNTGSGRCPWSTLTCARAASNGHIHILKWLCDPTKGGDSCPCDAQACAVAAQYNQLDTLKHLRDPTRHGGSCPWDEMACRYAAEKGHLDVLIWLRNPNTGSGSCPWRKKQCLVIAREYRQPHIVAWIISQQQ